VRHSRSSIRDCLYVYICAHEVYKTCEQPTRRAKQRNHIDPEPYTRHSRRVRINKDFPSRASSRTGEYFKHPPRSTLFLHSTHSRSPPSLVSLHHTSPFLAPCRLSLIRTFIISARETFFIDCPGTNLSDTGCKLFHPFILQEVLLLVFFSSFHSFTIIHVPFSLARTLSTSFSPTCRVGMNT